MPKIKTFILRTSISSVLFLTFFSGKPCDLFANKQHMIFSTWEVFEADKCATIWLIKKFINKNATIKFFPEGETIEQGLPFDTPNAELRRFHNRTTFGSFIDHYRLRDEKLEFIRQIIYDIEINIWDKKRLEETAIIQQDIDDILNRYDANKGIINKCCDYFDQLYRRTK